MEFFTILNYATGEVYYDELTEADNILLKDDIEAFFRNYGLNTDECGWMFTRTPPHLKSFKED